VHIAPAYAESGEGSDHFGSYVCSLSLYFCTRLFPAHEPMTSWSQGNRFTIAPGLPFQKGSPVHVALACTRSGEEFNHFVAYEFNSRHAL
jgi:hypothetical protein